MQKKVPLSLTAPPGDIGYSHIEQFVEYQMLYKQQKRVNQIIKMKTAYLDTLPLQGVRQLIREINNMPIQLQSQEIMWKKSSIQMYCRTRCIMFSDSENTGKDIFREFKQGVTTLFSRLWGQSSEKKESDEEEGMQLGKEKTDIEKEN